MKEKAVAHRETLTPHDLPGMRQSVGCLEGSGALGNSEFVAVSHMVPFIEEKHHAGVKVYKHEGTHEIIRELII